MRLSINVRSCCSSSEEKPKVSRLPSSKLTLTLVLSLSLFSCKLLPFGLSCLLRNLFRFDFPGAEILYIRDTKISPHVLCEKGAHQIHNMKHITATDLI